MSQAQCAAAMKREQTSSRAECPSLVAHGRRSYSEEDGQSTGLAARRGRITMSPYGEGLEKESDSQGGTRSREPCEVLLLSASRGWLRVCIRVTLLHEVQEYTCPLIYARWPSCKFKTFVLLLFALKLFDASTHAAARLSRRQRLNTQSGAYYAEKIERFTGKPLSFSLLYTRSSAYLAAASQSSIS